MSNSITDDKLADFVGVTGATNERARFYLEAANGNLEMAIESFFEGGNDDDLPIGEPQGPASKPTRPTAPVNLNDESDDDDDDDEDYRPSRGGMLGGKGNPFSGLKPQESNKTKKPSGNSRFATISSMNKDEDMDEDEDEEKGQAFYAGGSQTSGQQILGPPKKNAEKIIKNLFEKAKEHGAEEVNSNEGAGATSSKRGAVVYGNGYRLGTGNEPTEIIPGPSRPKPPKTNILKLWKNGFTVDDGELRSFNDPANKAFLASIQRGEPPRELILQAEGAEVHLDMQDHRDEEYEPPKSSKLKLYNDGYKLGSPTPTVVSNASPNDVEKNESMAKQDLALKESEPSTQIQIRLSNGSKLVIKANQTHKISDIRRYINRARPEYSSRVYSLMTSFPNKELTNDNETLSQAGLLNAVIIQKLKE